jgi:hypothetical protein
MQYALLIYTKPGGAEALGADEQEANHREYLDIRKLPGVVGGAALHPVETATTVRVQDGHTLVTDFRRLRPRRGSHRGSVRGRGAALGVRAGSLHGRVPGLRASAGQPGPGGLQVRPGRGRSSSP